VRYGGEVFMPGKIIDKGETAAATKAAAPTRVSHEAANQLIEAIDKAGYMGGRADRDRPDRAAEGRQYGLSAEGPLLTAPSDRHPAWSTSTDRIEDGIRRRWDGWNSLSGWRKVQLGRRPVRDQQK
jgi:hypothetical protein